MNKGEISQIEGEPVAYRWWESKWGEYSYNEHGMDNKDCAPLYTEAQLLAAYAKGAEDMRERADDAWSEALQSDCENGVKWLSERVAEQLHKEFPALASLGATIRALSITPTEGEQ